MQSVGGKRKILGLAAMVAFTLVVLFIHVLIGTTLNLGFGTVIQILLHGPNGSDPSAGIVWQLRLPRAVACVLVGGLLAGAGSAFQALFKNRLAEPYTVGTASGAAIGGVISLLIGLDAGYALLGTPALAFVAGMASLGLVMFLARRRGVIETPTLLLAGVLVGALLNALMALALYWGGRDTNVVLHWLMGSMDPAWWSRDAMMAVVLMVCGGLLVRNARNLNALAFGEEAAARLGADVRKLKIMILIAGGAMTAAAVGSAGIIAFVGLVAPHLARRVVGVDWRFSLPGAIMMGSSLVLTADLIGMRAIKDGVPVGVMTALIGAPFLLALLGRRG